MNRRLRLQLAECLDAVHDALGRVLIDGYGDELGLANADDGSHNQHCLKVSVRFYSLISRIMDTDLGAESIDLPLVARQLREAEDELRQSTGQNRTSIEVAAKDQGYHRRGLMNIF